MNGLMQRQRLVAATLVVAAIGCASGCIDSEKTVQETKQRHDLERRVAELERELQARDQTGRVQQAQIQTLQGIDGERLKLIPHADRIEIDSLSGGYGGDLHTGSEGVSIYLRPFDEEGDPTKAAGSVEIQVLDLAAPRDRQLVAECKLDPTALRKTWYSKFMTGHYTLKCPWKAGAPRHATLTVRVQFTDLLTGRSFELVKQVTIKLPLGASGG